MKAREHSSEVEARFLAKIIEAKTGCWVWTASINNHGYGRFSVGSKTDGTRRLVRAHRWAYEHFVGPVPDALELDHSCCNPACVNPEHLRPVTHRANMMRGSGAAAENHRKTHCPQGHEYTQANTYVSPRGWRKCRACNRVMDKASK